MWFAELMAADHERAPSGPADSGDPRADGAVARARAALERGERWRARDILEEHLDGSVAEPGALALLGEVYHVMGDLPAAGAAWFGAGVRGPEVTDAVAAWREHFGDDFPRMWRSLPRCVRLEPRSPKVEALRARALEASTADDPAAEDGAADDGADGAADGSGGMDAAQIIAWLLAAVFVVAAVVGLVTILRWLVPGG